ncbi:hypothetical protein ZPAH1_orf00315 [Aeromonas phage ZPAH1]|nr:hypothetical protein ASwh1_267 [Aeromonas phage Aswh_1]QQG34077.1 hypothetical protein ZPAH1_orf00315 [Aeromonas phage ZPAH1]
MLSFKEYISLEEKIEHRNGKWYVMDSTGSKELGEHDSKEKAVAQLQAIEINKHK